MEQTIDGSMLPGAKTVGVVYLLYFLTAFLGTYLSKGLVVPGNAAATAKGILAHEALYRSGFAVGLVANAIYIVLTALLYRLFEQVNRNVSLLAAFLSLAGCTMQIAGGVLQLAPLLILSDAQLARAFTGEQLQVAAYASLTLYSRTISIALVLFAFFDLAIGYLIVRSTFLPRALGVFMMVAGVGWLTFLWPPLAQALSPYVLAIGGLAEVALMLWLLRA